MAMKALLRSQKILLWVGTISMIGGGLLVTDTLINEYSHWRGVGLAWAILGANAITLGTLLRITGPLLEIYLAGVADGRANRSQVIPFRKASRIHHSR